MSSPRSLLTHETMIRNRRQVSSMVLVLALMLMGAAASGPPAAAQDDTITPQTFIVGPQELIRSPVPGTHDFSTFGRYDGGDIGVDVLDLALLPCEQTDIGGRGPDTFTDADDDGVPDGFGATDTGNAAITRLNGTGVPDDEVKNDVIVRDGGVTWRISSVQGPDCATTVAFDDQNDDGVMNVDPASGVPVEPYGVGQVVFEETYAGRVSSGMNLNVRNGPSLGNDVVDSAAPGEQLTILCKVRGRTIDGNSLWYRLDRDPPVGADRGYWVSARYVDNIGEVPDYCGEGRFFDGRTTTALNYRAGPTTDALLYGTFEAGTEVRPLCKVPGEVIDGNPLWYRLPEGRWASARYIENIGEPPPLCR